MTVNFIDRHVGRRMRLRRISLGLGRCAFGEAIGVTPAQLRDYENGVQRLGAAKLRDVSRILAVPPAFFFDNAPILAPSLGEMDLTLAAHGSVREQLLMIRAVIKLMKCARTL